MKYQVKRTCYYNHRLYEEGEVVTLEGSVPEHFSPLPMQNEINVGNDQEILQLEKMSVAQLKLIASNHGLTIKTNKKADIIAAIRGE